MADVASVTSPLQEELELAWPSLAGWPVLKADLVVFAEARQCYRVRVAQLGWVGIVYDPVQQKCIALCKNSRRELGRAL